MKKALWAIILIFASCHKDSYNANISTSSKTTWTVDGINQTSDSTIANMITRSNNTRMLDITVYQSGKSILILKRIFPKVGDQFSPPPSGVIPGFYYEVYQTNGSPADEYYSNSGSFNLSTCDTTTNMNVLGTFSFMGSAAGGSSKSVSNGKLVINKLNHL